MSYQFESLQSVLPPTVSAGWNDPPVLTGAPPPTTAVNHLKQMRTRPVDPSVNGPGRMGYGNYGAQQNPYGPPAGYTGAPQGYPGQGYGQAPQGYPGQTSSGPYGQPQGPAGSYSQSSGQFSPSQGVPAQFSPNAITQQPGFFPGGQSLPQRPPSVSQLSPTQSQFPQGGATSYSPASQGPLGHQGFSPGSQVSSPPQGQFPPGSQQPLQGPPGAQGVHGLHQGPQGGQLPQGQFVPGPQGMPQGPPQGALGQYQGVPGPQGLHQQPSGFQDYPQNPQRPPSVAAGTPPVSQFNQSGPQPSPTLPGVAQGQLPHRVPGAPQAAHPQGIQGACSNGLTQGISQHPPVPGPQGQFQSLPQDFSQGIPQSYQGGSQVPQEPQSITQGFTQPQRPPSSAQAVPPVPQYAQGPQPSPTGQYQSAPGVPGAPFQQSVAPSVPYGAPGVSQYAPQGLQQPSVAYPYSAQPPTSNVAYYSPPADPSQLPAASQAVMPSVQHRPIYDAFAVTSGPQTSMKPDKAHFPIRPQTSQTMAPTPAKHAAWTQSVPLSHTSRSSSLGTSTPPTMTQPIESDPQSLIFAPPNAILSEVDGVGRGFEEMNFGRPLVKPAGDVSLSGQQLVAFLYKATTHLPPAKCEGVQLKLQQLNDFVNHGRLSDACLQKLNYLVDAIDRNLFTDAVMYFEQLQSQFPQELGHWGTGIRLLVNELRGSGRVGSAGTHIRNQ